MWLETVQNCVVTSRKVSGSVIDESCQKVAATHHAWDYGDEGVGKVNIEGEMDMTRDRKKERKKENEENKVRKGDRRE